MQAALCRHRGSECWGGSPAVPNRAGAVVGAASLSAACRACCGPPGHLQRLHVADPLLHRIPAAVQASSNEQHGAIVACTNLRLCHSPTVHSFFGWRPFPELPNHPTWPLCNCHLCPASDAGGPSRSWPPSRSCLSSTLQPSAAAQRSTQPGACRQPAAASGTSPSCWPHLRWWVRSCTTLIWLAAQLGTQRSEAACHLARRWSPTGWRIGSILACQRCAASSRTPPSLTCRSTRPPAPPNSMHNTWRSNPSLCHVMFLISTNHAN